MSLRLAWHDSGWNGRICKHPCENVYCVGRHSYPGDVISEIRDLSDEEIHKGQKCDVLKSYPACALSVNAFGATKIVARSNVPSWWIKNYGKNAAEAVDIPIPPYTACTWCYEQMYGDDVESATNNGIKYDNTYRFQKAKAYFKQFEPFKSLIFYYAGFSNPFSEGDQQDYVIIGVSRLKEIGDFYFYNNPLPEVSEKFAGGVVWQKPITSCYPEQGFRIPYEKYMDNEDVINRILFKPDNKQPFKYGSREVSNDDAINIIWRFIEIIDVLIEIGDDTEDWNIRKQWLNSLLSDLWVSRGAYPGFTKVLDIVGLKDIIPYYLSIEDTNECKLLVSQIKGFLQGETEDINGLNFNKKYFERIRRNFNLREDDEQTLLLEILPRFDLSKEQMENIISQDREDVSIKSSISDIIENPYIIFEQYIGFDSDDIIPLYKIDNGILPSPELGVEPILDNDSAERLRAFCIDELNKIASHSFGAADKILESINHRLEIMSDWKTHRYKLQNFKVDRAILMQALFIRKDEKEKLYLYLKDVYEDERIIQDELQRLADLPDISLKVPISKEKFYSELVAKESPLLLEASEEYENILKEQSEICMEIFNKPISVLSGAAGTGKTTVIKALIANISRVHGSGAAVLIMTPTGKATERVKKQTGKSSTTIHSFLAQNGWINENFTFKRVGGSKETSYNTIIIDECSMIDLNLFATLVRAINWNSVQRLILVGDPNQLPPIGRGRVFYDTIEWLRQYYPKNIGVLKHNIRQLENKIKDNGTGILELANVFIQELQNKKEMYRVGKDEIFEKIQQTGCIDKDLDVYYWKNKDELETLLKERLIVDMEKETNTQVQKEKEYLLWTAACTDKNNVKQAEHIQLISPYRGEFYGTEEINRYMQNTFNGYWSNRHNIDGISLYDKVIQYRNRPKSNLAYAYDINKKQTVRTEVYNGEMGFVQPHGFDYSEKTYRYKLERFQVAFSGESRRNYRYNYGKNLFKDNQNKWIPEQKPIDNLELAYAISVHKSQGSEFDNVYIIIPKRDSHLLSMELLYTAITRAQHHLTILIQEDVSTLANLSRIEKSAVRRINSSTFKFEPLPEDLLYFNSWYESGKKLATLTECLVRSKSEVIIANLLYAKEIPFKYEEPLFAPDGTMFLPDFTVTLRGETYYWEHVGMLHNEAYKKHWEKKEAWYRKHFPDKLIVTYESDSLTKDVEMILAKYK